MDIRKIDEKGITLLETMIAMLIISFAFMFLMQMAVVAIDGNQWASETTRCTQLLQDKLEQLRSESNPVSGQDTVGTVSRSWHVTTVAPHLRQVQMKTGWITPDSVVTNYAITTLIKTELP